MKSINRKRYRSGGSKKRGSNRSRTHSFKKYKGKRGSVRSNGKITGKWKNWESWGRGGKKADTVRRRQNMKENCGSKCFGRPASLNYPLCRSDCSYDRAALLSAKIRSQRWHHEDVTRKVTRIMKKFSKKRN